jgi:Cu/Ag efflux protein CusF
MNQIKRMLYVAGIALASWTGVAIAQQGQDQLPPGTTPSQADKKAPAPTEMVGQLMHMTAAVQKVDLKKRELTLKDDQNNQMILQVPEDVTRLDQVKKGDRINLDYYQSVALSLKKKGEATAPSEEKIVERKEGKLPGGLVARKINASVEVLKIDPTENKVTIKAPNGQVDTINVSDPDVQADLHKLKKGDQIAVTYSQALAASVTPKEK